jgi:hypothetical protein
MTGDVNVEKHETYMKPKNRNEAVNAQTPNGDAPQFRENPQTNEKIDAWIRANPERWQYFTSLPPDRMARKLVLNEIQKYERQQKMNNGIMKKLEGDPEAKQAYETLLRRVPEADRERATVSVARHVLRITAPREARQNAQTVGVGVKAA